MPPMITRGRGLNLLGLILALGVAGHAAHAAFDLGGSGADDFFDIYLYLGLIVSAAFVSGWRAVSVPHERAAWVSMTIGLGASAIGFILGQALARPRRDTPLPPPPFPSIADAFYLTFYPATYVTLILLARGRIRRVELGIW